MSTPSDKQQLVKSGKREWKRAKDEGVFGLSQGDSSSHNWSARQRGEEISEITKLRKEQYMGNR